MLFFRYLLILLSILFLFGCASKKGATDKSEDSVSSAPSKAQMIYEQTCASCHGVLGGGDGPAGASLNPKPRNFQKEVFQAGFSLDEIANTIANGFKNGTTGMIGWKSIFESPQEIKEVAEYVLKLKNMPVRK